MTNMNTISLASSWCRTLYVATLDNHYSVKRKSDWSNFNITVQC